jgi:hypothetical protein
VIKSVTVFKESHQKKLPNVEKETLKNDYNLSLFPQITSFPLKFHELMFFYLATPKIIQKP